MIHFIEGTAAKFIHRICRPDVASCGRLFELLTHRVGPRVTDDWTRAMTRAGGRAHAAGPVQCFGQSKCIVCVLNKLHYSAAVMSAASNELITFTHS